MKEKVVVLDYKEGMLFVEIDFWGTVAKLKIPLPDFILSKIRQVV